MDDFYGVLRWLLLTPTGWIILLVALWSPSWFESEPED